jgi:hypothetical protein
MFLNYIKEFSVKKIINRKKQGVKYNAVSGIIKTVGLISDQRYFSETEALIKELVATGILEGNIEILSYGETVRKSSIPGTSAFTSKDLKWNAKIDNVAVNAFIDKEFDLLISFYSNQKAVLVLATYQSKAHFKVGFSTIDKRLNNLIINTAIKNHTVFTQELIRYLKILNKI